MSAPSNPSAQSNSSTSPERPELPMRIAAIKQAAQSAAEYLQGLDSRPVAPRPESVAALRALCGPLPEASTDAEEVIRSLHEFGAPATLASAGGRL